MTSAGADRYMRKAKELIQAMRVSETFPGEQGKDRIITAYLNEIFYGHGAYGIAAAALIYFGVSDLAELTPAQAALLAARLLPTEVTSAGSDRYMRKAKELIQAMRLSETFPGEQGKDRIITAYLNEIFYGHGAYGIAAAALHLLRRLRPGRPDAGPGRPAGRAAQVALDARSVPLRRQG